jgi:uncharacterized protein with von Willebrand factor type A (vWA) domain
MKNTEMLAAAAFAAKYVQYSLHVNNRFLAAKQKVLLLHKTNIGRFFGIATDCITFFLK